ncbi:hypothetical protein [Thermoactinospora rubra]|uniref:hypothetical protein n=1 Tax=Thermoactinospora rubra TaxID=1088767 RepID=UPI0011812A94|nr:hypothetical protein [Thermoactinospora rubra]
MDLLSVIQAVRRRWLVALLLLTFTITGTAATYLWFPWSYEAHANVVFLSSQQLSKEAGGNPYLYFDSSLKVTAEIVGRTLMGESQAEKMAAQGLTAEYTVALAPDSVGPLLNVMSESDDPKVAQATLDHLLKVIPEQVDALQSSLPQQTRVRTKTIPVTESPELKPTEKIRIIVVVAGLGLVLTFAAPAALEASAQRRRSAAARLQQEGEQPPPSPAPAGAGRSPDRLDDRHLNDPLNGPLNGMVDDIHVWTDEAALLVLDDEASRDRPAGRKVAGPPLKTAHHDEETGRADHDDHADHADHDDRAGDADTVTFAIPWQETGRSSNGDGPTPSR